MQYTRCAITLLSLRRVIVSLGFVSLSGEPRAFRLSGVHVIELTADILGARSSSAPKQAGEDASPSVATAEAGAGVWACRGFVSLFCEHNAATARGSSRDGIMTSGTRVAGGARWADWAGGQRLDLVGDLAGECLSPHLLQRMVIGFTVFTLRA